MAEDFSPPDSRANFNKTWLTESPEGLGSFDLVDAVVYGLKDRIKHGAEVVDLGNGYRKIEGTQVVYYWFEDKYDGIILAAEFEKAPQALVVRGIGKTKKGRPPFASDLYSLVLADRKSAAGIDAIRIMSDTQLSDEGYSIWAKMLANGHKLAVYDKETPGRSLQDISSEEELRSFFKDDDRSFRRYQYVLSESTHYGEVRSHFNTRRMRELSGQSVD